MLKQLWGLTHFSKPIHVWFGVQRYVVFLIKQAFVEKVFFIFFASLQSDEASLIAKRSKISSVKKKRLNIIGTLLTHKWNLNWDIVLG